VQRGFFQAKEAFTENEVQI